MLNWIFEIELIICLKMDLVLNNLQSWYAMELNQTRSALSWSGSIGYGPIYGLNRTQLYTYSKLNCLE